MPDFGVTPQKAAALEARMAACGVREADLEETYCIPSKPGGRKADSTACCVCLRHAPSGLQVQAQDSRRRGVNRYYARKRLCERLEAAALGAAAPEAKRRAKIRKQKQRRRRRSHSRPENPETS